MAALKKKLKVKKRIPVKKVEVMKRSATVEQEPEIEEEPLSFESPDKAYLHIHNAAKNSAEKYTYLSLDVIKTLDDSFIQYNKTIRNSQNEIAVKLSSAGEKHVKSLEQVTTMPLHFVEPREVEPPPLSVPFHLGIELLDMGSAPSGVEVIEESMMDDKSMLPVEWIAFKPEPLKGRGRQQQYPFSLLKPPIKDPQTGKTLYATFFVPAVEGVTDMRKRLMPSVARAIKQLHPALFECRNVPGGARVWRTM